MSLTCYSRSLSSSYLPFLPSLCWSCLPIYTGYTVHTSLAYVAEKIRQNDSDGGISAGTFQGQECLVLKGGSGDIRYTTYIYSYKGKLKELTLRDGTDASLSDGKDILAVADFSVSEIRPGLFRFTSTDTDGTTASVTISERSRQ